ncbi:hypothetical protein [Sphaerochaeta globosa]|nr:hypothetical protein [Sphaerochaeta globosa]
MRGIFVDFLGVSPQRQRSEQLFFRLFFLQAETRGGLTDAAI